MAEPDPVGELNRWLDQLARQWERFFARDPKVPTPPERERATLERRLLALSREEALGAAEGFRVQQLLHRFSAHNNLWQRQLREREEARRGQLAAERAANVQARPADVPAREANVSGPATVPSKAEGYEALHAEYLAALEARGRVGSLSLEHFSEALDKQRQTLEAKGSVVDGFEVVVEESQVKLRARLRRRRQS